MRDLNKFYLIDAYGKSSKKPYNRGKSFGYQVLGFGSGVAAAGFLPTQQGIFRGTAASNLVNSSGVVAADVTTVGTVANNAGGTSYGGDKAIFAFGGSNNISNLVSNTGVVQADTAGVGTARTGVRAATYDSNKGIFAYGNEHTRLNNLVTDAGVIGTDNAGAGTPRINPASASYSAENALAIFVYGYASGGNTNVSNLVNSSGVVGSDVSGVGTARNSTAGCQYGDDKAIIAYGAVPSATSVSNKISNVGVVATDTTGVGTARTGVGALSYGADKGVFAWGNNALPGPSNTNVNTRNLVNSSGVIASDATGAGTIRTLEGGAEFGN
jgi:hypothetical protein